MNPEWNDVFLHRVKASGDCLEFTGALDRKGYGRQSFRGKAWLSHRVSYEVATGPIPDGMFVCHKCDNPACVNPDHLFAGSHRDNTDDMLRKGRSQRRRGESHSRVKLTGEQVVAIKLDPRTHREIAGDYGISLGYVHSLKVGRAWSEIGGESVRNGYARGERNANSKLTYEAAEEIRSDERSISEIARKHGVSRATVRNIKRNLIWVKDTDGSLTASGCNS